MTDNRDSIHNPLIGQSCENPGVNHVTSTVKLERP